MFNHEYPAWHKPVQRVLFIIGALLCITLPVAYGKRRRISSRTLGLVLGLYFGLWLLFTLIVRFLVPSPRVESTLPTYTPSPIPVPVVLHSPSRSDAMPTSPAIRLHTSSFHSATHSSGTTRSGRGARFAVHDDDDNEEDDDQEDVDTKDGSLTPAQQQTGTRSNTNSVKFQTRPRGNTGDSTDSANYPTFATYRQAQHGSLDAFAQRIKRAFLSQQQQQQEEMERQKQLQEHAKDASLVHTLNGSAPINLQSLAPLETNAMSDVGSDIPIPPYNAMSAATTMTTTECPTASRSRSSSSAAGSLLGDFAERIKSGSLFSRSSTSLAPPTRSMTDPPPRSHPEPQPAAAGSRSRLSLSSLRPKSPRSPSRLGMEDGASMAAEDGLEIVVTREEDPETHSAAPRRVSKGDDAG